MMLLLVFCYITFCTVQQRYTALLNLQYPIPARPSTTAKKYTQVLCALFLTENQQPQNNNNIAQIMALKIDAEITDTWAELKGEKSTTNFIVVGYEGKTDLKLVAKGEGGLAEFVSKMDDKSAFYGVFRVIAFDNAESQRTKFVVVTWTGKDLKAMARASVAVHKSAIINVFSPHHLELQVSSVQELDQESIEKKLNAATGAHKPTGYKF